MDIKLTRENLDWYMAFIKEMQEEAERSGGTWHRLNKCQAWYKVCDNGDIILRSYNTIVAAIPAPNHDDCVDFSRVVYGFTATTSQHISKFARQFGTTKIIIRG